MNNSSQHWAWIGTTITFLSASIAENEIAQWILFALGIAGAIMTLVANIIRLVQLFRDAKKDGTIDEAEKTAISQQITSVADSIQGVADACNKNTKEE